MTVDIGKYFVDREQPPLTSSEQEIVHRFHDLYYRRWKTSKADTINLSWFGHQVWKCPLDLWIYQELLVRHRPEFVVETGTHRGGSALFMATILDHIGSGSILSIDIKNSGGQRPTHPRINYIMGSSVDPAIVAQVKEKVAGRRALVILDSDHQADHVFAEIEAYSSLVPLGSHLIVEDTNVNGHPAFPEYGPGPMEAVERFLAGNDEFAIDAHCERFMMTLNPRGYLQRVKSAPPSGGRREESAGAR